MFFRSRKSREVAPAPRRRRHAIEPLESRLLLAAAPINGLAGVYYNNTALSGSPVAARVDPTVNFNWSGSPATGVGSDNFSVRWSGQLLPKVSGIYSFVTSSDDGVRLYVNGQKII